jgi:hypothetical protein
VGTPLFVLPAGAPELLIANPVAAPEEIRQLTLRPFEARVYRLRQSLPAGRSCPFGWPGATGATGALGVYASFPWMRRQRGCGQMGTQIAQHPVLAQERILHQKCLLTTCSYISYNRRVPER